VHAAVRLLAVLLASLLAMCNFEQLARWIKSTYLTSSEEVLGFYLFFDSAIGIFAVCLTILLWGVHRILPIAPEVAARNETAGRWGFGIMTGYLLAAFLVTVIQTFPGPQDFWGSIPPDADQRPGPIMSCAPDYQFLALTEYALDHAFPATGDWLLDRPIISADSQGGRWSSFPYRYHSFRMSVREYFGETIK
jgi:hypothetical protein